ncbi:hypothetical protein ACTWLI_12130 [Arthrobacter sp. Hor0625]|uniref:hypothetical protein n=1 Tax=Arthrobacter sp. Hor0625 TaxID=3457358 RepID=UPI00403E90BE
MKYLTKFLQQAGRSRGFIAVVVLGLSGATFAAVYFIASGAVWGIFSVMAFTGLAISAIYLLIRIRWVQETESRRLHARLREVKQSLIGLTGPEPANAQQKPFDSRVSERPAVKAPTAFGANPVPPAGGTGPRSVGTKKVAGRLAAAVAQDGDRQAEILRFLGSPPAPDSTRRAIFTVVGHDLRELLLSEYHVEVLSPSTIMAQLRTGNGTTVVLDDAAFAGGVWYGVDAASGTPLADTLLAALAWCKEAGVPVYFVRRLAASNVYTQDISAASDVVVDKTGFDAEWTEDYEFGLLGKLSGFIVDKERTGHKNSEVLLDSEYA